MCSCTCTRTSTAEKQKNGEGGEEKRSRRSTKSRQGNGKGPKKKSENKKMMEREGVKREPIKRGARASTVKISHPLFSLFLCVCDLITLTDTRKHCFFPYLFLHLCMHACVRWYVYVCACCVAAEYATDHVSFFVVCHFLCLFLFRTAYHPPLPLPHLPTSRTDVSSTKPAPLYICT